MSYTVASAVLSAAASYDLTTLAVVKDELSIGANTSSDTWLQRTIRRISSMIATDTNRVFPVEYVQDVIDVQQDPYPYQTPGGFAQLALSRFPIASIVSLTQETAINAAVTLIEGTDFRCNRDTGELLRLNPFSGVGTSWEALPVTVNYLAGYGSAVREAITVPASAPYHVTISQTATFSCDQAVTDSSGTALTRVPANPAAGQYSVDATGTYSFNAAQAGQSLAVSYGVNAIPDDLEECCVRMIVARFRSRGRDPALMQRDQPGEGSERWWVGGAPGSKGPYPPDIDAILENYRMPVVA